VIPLLQVTYDLPNLLRAYYSLASIMFHRDKFNKCIEYCKLAIYIAENHNYTGMSALRYKILLTKTHSYIITG